MLERSVSWHVSQERRGWRLREPVAFVIVTPPPVGGMSPGGDVDLDVVGGVTMLSTKQSATSLAKCYHIVQSATAPILGKLPSSKRFPC